MSNQLLPQVLTFLQEEKDFVVAAKKIWHKVKKLPQWRTLSFEEFLNTVQQSPEIDVIGSGDENPFKDSGLTAEEMEKEVREMEKMGYFFGPSLVLKSHVPTPEELATFLQNKVDQAYNTLLKAWENRPQGDPESEDQLLSILAEVQKLRREIRQNAASPAKEKRISDGAENAPLSET